ncbi:uncharacterized protein LACBIDRAFT_322499 [Laccaria bicolor S238N-H82]|uniref:Predicted protein n=1 Tax=Laccaria bicolor (strain S238N-H82 / ATCC MYA-4686) TaxID=486041 RepID=B0CWI1_LACBS|nr:uncharacterized protein LACBIDRAFT_322499 [Laccaria bicolor S238N-H82]EDR13514.1 predicted protein [Laccaria bicolor S238N-H82]|eukprot:XP_001876012.1 predicted protein [Laccaria bicolor S238N-H82]
MTYFPCGLPSKWKVARKGMLHVPKTLQETVYETVNSSWRPSCASISLNVDSFGYYFMARKRSDKPFTKPSTPRGDSFGYYFISRKHSDKPFTKPSTLRGDAPTNHLRIRHPFVETLLHIVKTIQQTVYESINSSWRPSCASISLNVDSFGYYFMSRKRSDKPFTKPSTLRGAVYETVNSSWRPSCVSISFNVDSFGYYLTSRKRSDKPFMNPSTLRGDLPVLDFPQCRLVWILLHVPKTLQQTIYESIIPSWRYTLLHIVKTIQQTVYESITLRGEPSELLHKTNMVEVFGLAKTTGEQGEIDQNSMQTDSFSILADRLEDGDKRFKNLYSSLVEAGSLVQSLESDGMLGIVKADPKITGCLTGLSNAVLEQPYKIIMEQQATLTQAMHEVIRTMASHMEKTEAIGDKVERMREEATFNFSAMAEQLKVLETANNATQTQFKTLDEIVGNTSPQNTGTAW